MDIQRSSRDPEELRARLEDWLRTKLPAGSEPRVQPLESSNANGMSSDTVLFDATWKEGDADRHERLVGRIAPQAGDVPVFPEYNLEAQFDVLRLVEQLTGVPVPKMFWYEGDEAVIGAPFFVMGRVDGRVPPDVMPYNFGDSWVYEAAKDDQDRLRDSTVQVLADLHAIDRPTERFAFLEFDVPGDTHLRRHVNHTRAFYDYAVADLDRSPLVERAFAWLEAHWPEDEGDTVLSWGDSRIGNVMYGEFEPVAVLDWEMVGLGPRELDLGWLVFAHEVFETLTASFDLPGMPDFLAADDVCATYERLTGHTPRNLDFYRVYAGIIWAAVFMRTGRRSIHFGEIERPDDIESLFHHKPLLERLLADDA